MVQANTADASGASDKPGTYNSAAVRIATALTEARAATAPVPRDRPIEKRFPASHRPGLGVALEYERMGNRPVSEELEGRGNELGVHFEHLGTTLGSVIHGIDLKAAHSDNEAPPIGGDTLFSDSHAACFGLPEGIREQLEHVQGINDYRLFLASRSLPEELIESIKEAIPFGVSHPLLRTHPETGKTGLYIHGGFLRHDSLYDDRTGEPLAEKEALRLVGTLLRQHDPQEYVCRFQWEPGSIAFWDNRAVQHYAASDYYPHERMIRRVTVSGDVPYYNPAKENS